MSITTIIKSIQDIMRQDSGVDGDAQRIGQLVWMIFLKVFDAKEQEWEILKDGYTPVIPEGLRWRDWAEDPEGITGEELIDFVNNVLFKRLKEMELDENSDPKAFIVKAVFEDSYNYMKSGTLMRQVINKLNEIDFTTQSDRHLFNDIYENILKDLQSAGKSGEYYTPRALTDFIIECLNPKIGEKVADFACGTGGFLVSAINHIEKDIKTVEEREIFQNTLFGIEKKPLPHLLCMTNLILHDIDEPNILRDNSLATSVKDYPENKKFDIIAMNPPFGGVEEEIIQYNFPADMRTSETADLFMVLIMNRLKENGRAGVILPDGFLFGDDNARIAIKKKLIEEFNLHTIVRIPSGAFAPYTPISTNILFFDRTKPTNKIDYYQVPLPEGLKNGFTKTKPLKSEHLDCVRKWWNNRNNGDINAYSVTIDDVINAGYNLDFKNPNITSQERDYSLNELLESMNEKAKRIEEIIVELTDLLKGVEE